MDHEPKWCWHIYPSGKNLYQFIPLFLDISSGLYSESNISLHEKTQILPQISWGNIWGRRSVGKGRIHMDLNHFILNFVLQDWPCWRKYSPSEVNFQLNLVFFLDNWIITQPMFFFFFFFLKRTENPLFFHCTSFNRNLIWGFSWLCYVTAKYTLTGFIWFFKKSYLILNVVDRFKKS